MTYNLSGIVSVMHVSYSPVIISVTYNLPVTISDLPPFLDEIYDSPVICFCLL